MANNLHLQREFYQIQYLKSSNKKNPSLNLIYRLLNWLDKCKDPQRSLRLKLYLDQPTKKNTHYLILMPLLKCKKITPKKMITPKILLNNKKKLIKNRN